MEVELTYMVPVIVTVDTDKRRVTEVAVQDEDARTPIAGLLDHDERHALDIAEESDWPEWKVGN